jgi:hypothetical protein
MSEGWIAEISRSELLRRIRLVDVELVRAEPVLRVQVVRLRPGLQTGNELSHHDGEGGRICIGRILHLELGRYLETFPTLVTSVGRLRYITMCSPCFSIPLLESVHELPTHYHR